MYILIQDNQLVILVSYVDDVILVSNDVDGLLIQFKCKLAKKVCHNRFGAHLILSWDSNKKR